MDGCVCMYPLETDSSRRTARTTPAGLGTADLLAASGRPTEQPAPQPGASGESLLVF